MPQLVGQECVHCRERISSVLEGRFCAECTSPVHDVCAKLALERPTEGCCTTCGSAAREVESRGQAAAQESWAQHQKKRQKQAVWVLAGGGCMTLYWLSAMIRSIARGSAPGDYDFTESLGGVLVGVIVTVCGFVLLARRSG